MDSSTAHLSTVPDFAIIWEPDAAKQAAKAGKVREWIESWFGL
jgi:hypothetical protein